MGFGWIRRNGSASGNRSPTRPRLGSIAGRMTVIACPKQREHDQTEKLTAIFRENEIRSVTLVRMFVPCCGGLEYAVYQALAACGKEIPLRIVTVGADGKILKTEEN